MSTTIREAERIPAFLKTAKEIEGEDWNDDTQKKFQILLIKNREYLDPAKTQSLSRLNPEQIKMLKDPGVEMTYEQARGIFEAKNYQDPAMRGRNSMSPLIKLGLIDKTPGKIILTDSGNKLLNQEIALDEFMFDSLLKLQYSNKIENERKDWNTKPFINTLRLIKKVNELCQANNMHEKGLTKIEFGIFALSLNNYNFVDVVAQKVIEFRTKYEKLSDNNDKEVFRKSYIAGYLVNFQNPEHNTKEYTDNVIRYMRITKYIYIRGKYGTACIDLEPRRMVEINSLLENDNGAAFEFETTEEWVKYFGTYGSYELPFETTDKLQEILSKIIEDINSLENKLNIAPTTIVIPTTKEAIKTMIAEKRAYRSQLQNQEIKIDFGNDINKINETINALQNIRKLDMKPSIALEKWVNVALNILNDALLIKPNSIVGDDNEPTFTAPAGVADIECFYENFNATCEVTMLTSRDQWFNEGQPVMRHLREFENIHTGKECYCLFVAPSLHVDTIATYFMNVKHGYDGIHQKIVPITINQLVEMLKVVAKFRTNNKEFKNSYIKNLYDSIVEIVLQNNSHSVWLENIPTAINTWRQKMEAFNSVIP